jgi:pimeloyl-ACP methyl ester carboxylesterase
VTESRPEARYARRGDTHIAYQRFGSGPPLLLVPDWFGHLDAMWEWPPFAHALRRLASFAEVVVFDKRGTGLSDPLPSFSMPGLEDWMDDVCAVLEDAAIQPASLVAVGAGGPMALQFAAMHPASVDRLVLVNSYARLLRAPDYPPGYPERVRDHILAEAYTSVRPAQVLAGSDDPAFLSWWLRFLRQSVSPSVAATMRRWLFEVDVRTTLPAVQCPTLVIHRIGDQWVRPDHGRHLAEHIADARLVELDGSADLFFQGDVDTLLDHVEEFLAGGVPQRRIERVLAAILFTDLVDSTALVARLGDRRWDLLMTDHDAIVMRQLAEHGGRHIKHTGDGTMALFDRPARAVRCATALARELTTLGLHIRAGVHAGEIDVRTDYVGGINVNIAARIMALGRADEVLVSRTVADLIAGSGVVLADWGRHVLKGVPGEWDVLAALN